MTFCSFQLYAVLKKNQNIGLCEYKFSVKMSTCEREWRQLEENIRKNAKDLTSRKLI